MSDGGRSARPKIASESCENCAANCAADDRSDCSASWKDSKSDIHLVAKSWGATSVLLKASTSVSFILYRIEHAYSMFDMNVTGFCERGVSTTYTITVGNDDASDSAMIWPEADHVKISIWPGVSSTTYLSDGARASTSVITCSKRVAKRLSAVRMPPFGPSWYCFITSW